MKKYLLLIILCNNSAIADTLPKKYYGVWQGDDKATLGIIGKLIISEHLIFFGSSLKQKKPTCQAQYSIVRLSPKNIFTLRFHNKKCNYHASLNPNILKSFNNFTIYTSQNLAGEKQNLIKDSSTCKKSSLYLFIRTSKNNTDFRFHQLH